MRLSGAGDDPAGAQGSGPNGMLGAIVARVAVFLPGFQILTGILPFWEEFRPIASAQSAMQGANAVPETGHPLS